MLKKNGGAPNATSEARTHVATMSLMTMRMLVQVASIGNTFAREMDKLHDKLFNGSKLTALQNFFSFIELSVMNLTHWLGIAVSME